MPDKATAYNSMEGLIQHFELIMPNRGMESPTNEIYAAVESPNGELGYYLVTDGSQTAWRTRTRPPSFIHFAVFPYIIKDHLLADIVAVLGSLNVIAAELIDNRRRKTTMAQGVAQQFLSEAIREKIRAYIRAIQASAR